MVLLNGLPACPLLSPGADWPGPPSPPSQELSESLQCQQLELECLTSLGEEILSTCHPDSVTTIKSWVTVAKSRLQEVSRARRLTEGQGLWLSCLAVGGLQVTCSAWGERGGERP